MNFRKAILTYLLKITSEIIFPLFLIFMIRYLFEVIDSSIIKPLEIKVSVNIFSLKGKISIIDLIIIIYWIFFSIRVACRSLVIIIHYHQYLKKLMQAAEKDSP